MQERNSRTTRNRNRIVWLGIAAAVLVLAVLAFIFKTPLSNMMNGARIDNVIVITIDTLRADYLSCYKKGTAATPHIDQLAAEGVIFDRCISPYPLTLPSHASILSGTYPLYHQVRDNGGLRVPPQLDFISEVVKKNGFKTAGFIAAYVLHSKWGMNQGFDTYSDDFDLTKYRLTGTELEKKAGQVLDEAKEWIAENKEDRFFTWIHLFDPHGEYEPPPPFDERHPDNPYAGEVEYTDDELGKFFAFLKKHDIYDNTLIVVTSDHGEGLWEHGERSHGFFVYESTVWVPLIIRAPRSYPQKRVGRIVELVDIAPTVVDMLGLDIPRSYQGVSLLPTMSGEKIDKPEVAYTESFYSRFHLGWSELQALYDKDLKYIRAPKEEFFDIAADPDETENLAAKPGMKNKKENVRRKLAKFISDESRNAITPEQVVNPSRKDRERLASLGYLTTMSAPKTDGPLPDPKDKVDFLNKFDSARRLMSQTKYDEVIRIAHGLLENEPNNVDTFMMLGVSYSRVGKPRLAIPWFRKSLKEKPDYNDAMINLLRVLNASGQYKLAIKEGNEFLKLFPDDNVIYGHVGDAYFYTGNFDRALEHLFKAVKIEPQNSNVFLRIGEIFLEKKDLQKAEFYLKKAIGIYRELLNAYMLMGRLEEARGNMVLAQSHYEREIDSYPSNYLAAFHLAEVLKKKGQYPQAIPHYRTAIEGDPNFKLPYLMIANYFMESDQNLEEAAGLCKKAIQIKPADEATLFGYFILTNVYSKLKDQAKFQYYTKEGEKLYNALQAQKKK